MSNPSRPTPRSAIDVRILIALVACPTLFFLSQVGRWSMSGDEYYTWFDSSLPVGQLLSTERKPLYYLICHFLLSLDLGLSREVVVRLPAAVASGLIPAAFYALLARHSSRVAILTSLVALANPWLFQMSQFGRFYSLAFLFTTISALAAFRWTKARGSLGWLVIFVVAGLLAALSHTPSFIVVPAGIIAMLVGWWLDEPAVAGRFLKAYGLALGLCCLACGAIGIYAIKDLLYFWFTSGSGEFGSYSVPQILVVLALFGGISTWAMAVSPLLKWPRDWNGEDGFLVATILFSSLPLLILVPVGGGVAARYLMFCLPCVFVLAGRHWSEMAVQIPTNGLRAGLAISLLAFNLPYLASTLIDGNHYDFREAARRIDAMDLERPIIVSSEHALLDLYLRKEKTTSDLTIFDAGVPRDLIQAAIDQAIVEQRPLLLVSREDRVPISPEDQEWLYARFAKISTIEKPRLDHRRLQLVVYQYRPAQKQAARTSSERLTSLHSRTAELADVAMPGEAP